MFSDIICKSKNGTGKKGKKMRKDKMRIQATLVVPGVDVIKHWYTIRSRDFFCNIK